MTTESLMIHAFKRGLSLSDFEVLTTGMILGAIIEYNNIEFDDKEKETVRMATQDDFDKF
jgi:hypothetical protein